MNYIELPTFKAAGFVRCVIESPRGSLTKYKYDPETQAFELSRPLPKGLDYPFDWGFVPSTAGEDGDPLDVMVLHCAASHPGIVIVARLIGVLEVLQREGKKQPFRNDRLFAVPMKSESDLEIDAVDDLPQRLRQELEQFFIAAVRLEGKELEILGWKGHDAAGRLISEGQNAFAKRHAGSGL